MFVHGCRLHHISLIICMATHLHAIVPGLFCSQSEQEPYRLLTLPVVTMSLGSKTVGRVDWSRVLERCTPSARKSIMDLRSNHEELRRQILEASQNIPKLDMEQYRRKLPVAEYEGMLNELEDRVKNYQPPKVDVTQKLKELEAEKQVKV